MCSDLAAMDGPDAAHAAAAAAAAVAAAAAASSAPSPRSAGSSPRSCCSPPPAAPSAAAPPAPSSASDDPCDDDEISVGCPSPAPSAGSSLTAAPAAAPTPAPVSPRSDEPEDEDSLGGGCGGDPASPSDDEDDYFKPLKRLKMVRLDRAEAAHQQRLALASARQAVPVPPAAVASTGPASATGGVKSFSIVDILNHRPREPPAAPAPVRIVRPWDLGPERTPPPPELAADALGSPCSSGRSSAAGSVTSDCCASPGVAAAAAAAAAVAAPPQSARSRPGHRPSAAGSGAAGGKAGAKSSTSPLDALFQMTSKTFEELNGEAVADGQQSHLALFNSRPQTKKKRKSRTAFTNHQIFELEKRFLYQKYLSPADRDEIAGQLGLTNAQVITWFQNRRAKLKRDMEELKKDVESSKLLTAHKSFLENVQDLGILKKKPSPPLQDDKGGAPAAGQPTALAPAAATAGADK